MSDLHPLLEPLAGMVGSWVGEGTGQLPGHEPFAWRERFRVEHVGTPALLFRQRTTRLDGSPFHAEDGWVRVPPELQQGRARATRHVELAVTSPTGILEALAGMVEPTPDGLTMDAISTTIARTPAAGHVEETRRRWTLQDDQLTVEFWMARPDDPELFHHLTAHLHRDIEEQR